jgi:hypothetical protein
LEAIFVGNNKLIDIIRKEFSKLDDGGKLLLSVGCRDVLKLNVILLQFLINEQKLNGLYICVDIPQTNVERLVKKYDITKDGLKYIDAITGLSSIEREFNDNIFYIDNPFNVKIINEAINRVQADGVKRFVILDNMATLQFYSTEISNFFKNFIGSINDFNISYLVLAVDKIRHKRTYDIIRPFCDSEIEIKREWLGWLKE